MCKEACQVRVGSKPKTSRPASLFRFAAKNGHRCSVASLHRRSRRLDRIRADLPTPSSETHVTTSGGSVGSRLPFAGPLQTWGKGRRLAPSWCEGVNSLAASCDQLPGLQIGIRCEMATMNSAFSTGSECVVAAAFAAVLAIMSLPRGCRQGAGSFPGNRPEFRQRRDECRDRKGAGHAADVLGLLRRAKTVGDRSLPQGAVSESEEQWRAYLDGYVKKTAEAAIRDGSPTRRAICRQEGRRGGPVHGGRLATGCSCGTARSWRRDHPAAPEIIAEGRRRRASRAAGNPLKVRGKAERARQKKKKKKKKKEKGAGNLAMTGSGVRRATRLPGRLSARTNAPHG